MADFAEAHQKFSQSFIYVYRYWKNFVGLQETDCAEYECDVRFSTGSKITAYLHKRNEKQEAQLSQRSRAMLCVIDYFAKSLKVTQGYSK